MATDDNVRAAYTGIINLLPVDWQRLVNDQLPHLEGLIDQAVEQFGAELADYLVRKVEKTNKSGSEHADDASCALKQALTRLEGSQKAADTSRTAIDGIEASLSALSIVSATDVASRSLWYTNALRGLLDRLREDFAADRVEGLASYRVSLMQWRESAIEAGVIVDGNLLQRLDTATGRDHTELVLPQQPAKALVSSTLKREYDKADAVQRRLDEALAMWPGDDQLGLEQLGQALANLSEEMERVAGTESAPERDDLDGLRATATTLQRTMARAGTPALPDVPVLVTAWVDSMTRTTDEHYEAEPDSLPPADPVDLSADAEAVSENIAPEDALPEDVAPTPDSLMPSDETTATAPSLAPEEALTALRESLAQLQETIDRRVGLLPRLQEIKEIHAELAERLKEIVREEERSESASDEIEKRRRETMSEREKLLREISESTEDVVAKVMADALTKKACEHRDAVEKAECHIKELKEKQQAANDDKQGATTAVQDARRALAESRIAYGASVEAVRDGAQVAKLPILARSGPKEKEQAKEEAQTGKAQNAETSK